MFQKSSVLPSSGKGIMSANYLRTLHLEYYLQGRDTVQSDRSL
jgi:hypothetical protein